MLTHNRDEDHKRKASDTLIEQIVHNQKVTAPVDLKSKGTWIMTSEKWTTAILNGAKEKHHHNPPYKHSRGKFPYLLLSYADVHAYVDSLDLKGIEPFTQIIIDHQSNQFYELMWHGEHHTFRAIEEDFYVTLSATLYAEQEKNAVKEAFRALNTPNADNLAQLHKEHFWKFKPELPMIKTTSMVQIAYNALDKYMMYKNYQ